jgi:PHD/YefM family antitoxin component YafN of YafNO toxin-antitoxin module
MNSIPAQEIKRRGISAVDEALRDGPVHIIKNNRPSYVVLTEADFSELLQVQQEAARESLRASLEDLKAGRTNRYKDADALMRALDLDTDA